MLHFTDLPDFAETGFRSRSTFSSLQSLLVAGQKPATYIFNSFLDEILLEKKKIKFKCLEHITIAFV